MDHCQCQFATTWHPVTRFNFHHDGAGCRLDNFKHPPEFKAVADALDNQRCMKETIVPNHAIIHHDGPAGFNKIYLSLGSD